MCAQRVQHSLNKELESYNAEKMQGNQSSAFSMTRENASCCFTILSVLRYLVHGAGRDRIILLVSERLPSTLVKVLKAMASNSSSLEKRSDIMDVMLDLVGSIICNEEVVQELMESSTLHRLFHFSFPSRSHQLAGILVRLCFCTFFLSLFAVKSQTNISPFLSQIVEKLVRSVSRDKWKSRIVPHFFEHKCLLDLAGEVADAEMFAKVLSISSHVLKHSITAGSTVLHEQLRQNHYYEQMLARFMKIFEAKQETLVLSSTNNVELEQPHDQDVTALAVGEFCLSGSESGRTFNDVASQKSFSLLNDLSSASITKSSFNCDAFGLLSDILKYLQSPTPIEMQATATHVRRSLQTFRERLECKFIERIGRILFHNRYDYVLVAVSVLCAHVCKQPLPHIRLHLPENTDP